MRKKSTQISNPETEDTLQRLLQQPGNQLCADCFRHSPYFVDVDHSVFVCTTCSSIHRSLSFHMKSFHPIFGFTNQELEGLRCVGNEQFNRAYLAKLFENEIKQLTILQNNHQQLREHIHHKYVDKLWFSPESPKDGPHSRQPAMQTSSTARFESRTADALRATQAAGHPAQSHSPRPQPRAAPTTATVTATASSPGPPPDSSVVYAFAVGKDATARRAVRVSERYVKKNRIPSTSAVVSAAVEQEAMDVGMLEIVSPQSTTDNLFIMGSDASLNDLLQLDGPAVTPFSASSASTIAPPATSRPHSNSTYSLAS